MNELLRAEVEQHLRGSDEQGGVAGKQGGVDDILGDHRLAETLRSDDHDVAGAGDERRQVQKYFADVDGLNFPLLSDFWPHGAVATAYDVFDPAKGCARRSSYVIDQEGTVRWAVHNAMPDGRDLSEHLLQLQAIV